MGTISNTADIDIGDALWVGNAAEPTRANGRWVEF
jgi:hypothetical protein